MINRVPHGESDSAAYPTNMGGASLPLPTYRWNLISGVEQQQATKGIFFVMNFFK
jgi:hypothetical protein